MKSNATTRKRGERIEFRSIRQEHGEYYALAIYPPGTFLTGSSAENKKYLVFLGGSGHGERRTFADAKAFLHECAVAYCERRIAAAKSAIAHYERQLAILATDGLVPKTAVQS